MMQDSKTPIFLHKIPLACKSISREIIENLGTRSQNVRQPWINERSVGIQCGILSLL
jgi:hypothetical protein